MANTETPYQQFTDEPCERATVSGKRFYVQLAGKTNEAHNDFVEKLKSIGHTEVKSLEQCDYVVLFCPISSRVGTDIAEAENSMPAGKPTILVVMHHTFNPENVIAGSSRNVNNSNIRLTVDCLFYNDHFLHCNLNDNAWYEVQKSLGVSVTQDSNQKEMTSGTINLMRECWKDHMKLLISVFVFVCVVVIVAAIVVIVIENRKQK